MTPSVTRGVVPRARSAISVRVSTNAAAATREVVALLKGTKIRSFKITMEGASEEVYDQIRGEPGSFRAALQGIENLKELGVPIFLQTVFMKPNVSQLPALVRLGESLKAQKLNGRDREYRLQRPGVEVQLPAKIQVSYPLPLNT